MHEVNVNISFWVVEDIGTLYWPDLMTTEPYFKVLPKIF